MIRALPLIVIGLLFAWLGLNVSTLVLWLIAGACLLALIALILFMYWKDCFVGPRTLLEDAKRLSRRTGSEDLEEVEVFAREDLEDALDKAFEADGRRAPRERGNVTPFKGDEA